MAFTNTLADILVAAAQKLAKPKIMASTERLVEEGAGLARAVPQIARDYINGEPILGFLKDQEPKVGGYISNLMQEFHDPPAYLSRFDSGRKIVEDLAGADIKHRQALSSHYNPGERIKKGIKEGSPEWESVTDALENPTLAENLSPQLKQTHDFLKGEYDFWGQEYTKHLAGGDEGYAQVVRLAERNAIPEEIPQELKKAYNFHLSLKKNYAPHVFDNDEALEKLNQTLNQYTVELNALKSSGKTYKNVLGDIQRVPELESKIAEYQASIQRIVGGDPLAYESLPKEFLFKSGMERKGAEGYSRDAWKQYKNYLYNITKKMYIDPAIQRSVERYNLMPVETRPYLKSYLRDFAGYNGPETAWDNLAGKITSFQYMRTLGWNFRSPLVNLTQQFNTIADAGPRWAMKGYARAFTREGKELWEKSGLATEIPSTLREDISPSAGRLEKTSRVLGYFFNLAETANRKHALLSYFSKYEAQGLPYEEALKKAIEGVHKTQFLYGKVGQPMAFRSPLGRVAGQFSSYTIKQLEFLYDLARKDPVKFIGWMGMTGGTNYALGNVLGIDLSNTLGFGVNFGEALDMVRSASKGDIEEAIAHGKLAIAEGSGILPSTVGGPTLNAIMNIAQAVKKGEPISGALYKEVMPVSWQRVEDIMRSWDKRALAKEPGMLPKISSTGEYMYDRPTSKTMLNILLKSKDETKKQSRWYMENVYDQLESKRKRIIADLIIDGKEELAQKRMEQWKVRPSTDSLREAMLRKNLPREFRKRYINQENRQLRREEAKLREEVEE
jgi:hypothetical protein